mgnify:CR=1 FL=1
MLTDFVRRECLKRRIFEIPPDRRISIKGDLRTEQADSLIDSVNALNEASPVPILCSINSEGGDVEAGLSLCDAFRFSSAPVVALVVRRAHSAALLALQGCTERYALLNAKLGIHNNSLRWVITTEWKPDLKPSLIHAVEERVDELDKNREAAIQVFLERTKLPRADLEGLMNESKLMRTEEALELGFLDAVAM